jgi:hypothetical protein
MPRLGPFVGNERRLPIDYDEIIASIAPRPLNIVAPTLDRYAPVADVRRSVEAARQAYSLLGASSALEFSTPRGFNDLKNAGPSYLWLDEVDGPGRRKPDWEVQGAPKLDSLAATRADTSSVSKPDSLFRLDDQSR